AEGVGNSSGDWHCDTKWMGDHVITKSTRTWVLPTYGNHLYGPINFDGTTGSGANAAYAGYKTPWGYFDFNRFHCHFSPRDWQRLINNHTGIRPKGLKIKVFNVQVKEVTTQDSTKTIANNLTSTVQIFADENYDLPYVLGSATQGTFPPFPNDVFMLPQYAYCTLQGNSGKFVDRSAFYCLEYFPSQMLRTGNNFEFQFKFEEVPFHSGWAQSQSLDRLMNPLLDQYLIGDYGTDASGNLIYHRAGPNDLNEFYKNWAPAPYECIQNINSSDNTKNANSINGSNSTNKWGLQGRQAWDAPGFVQASTYEGAAAGQSLLNGVLTFDKSSATTSSPAATAVNRTIEDEIQGTNNFGNARNNIVAINQQTKGTNPTTGSTSQFETMPGMVWSNRDIYLQGPIWAKIPNTDGHFHPSPRMGGFGLKHPPPMILIKNTPVPADPPTTFNPMPQTSFITEYSTGQVTVEMLWEVQKESSKRWNPEVQFTSNFGTSDPAVDGIPFGINNLGTYVESRPIGTRYISKHL
nr:Chain 1, Capsid protein [Snake adeno-associated virus]7U94_2 Chain 2, Capsid protein [Snake adeno-associated virus]7U94_3 Chain 3, Capsid protein [Snake adeno-associated virus]7U94_4 Chain 4, Capsid protein [Snake adeno-associated virus]7U94_5 Chain 5, Capsid protein [Snake adeno-associated virus]7U94_6 Chain 6, Capsid protein [Snake adeno-associated virus]7U94_7 Chain 7, Capsid protein [Snake adeno-associated virus]7U94_8 Chain 8, Capsid protein [Snake adeno-associated virus]7U94_A Chai